MKYDVDSGVRKITADRKLFRAGQVKIGGYPYPTTMKTFVLLIIATGIVTVTFAQIFNKEIVPGHNIPSLVETTFANPVQSASPLRNNSLATVMTFLNDDQNKRFQLSAIPGRSSAPDQRKYFLTGNKNKTFSNSGSACTRFWRILRGISYIVNSLNGKGGLRLCCQKTALTFSPKTLKKVTGLTFSIPIGQ